MAVYYKDGVKYLGSAATREQNKDKSKSIIQTPATTNKAVGSGISRTPSETTNTPSYVTTRPKDTSFKSTADAIGFITTQKGNWESANQAGDENGKNSANDQANLAYTYLNNNGLADVSEQLKASGYADAKNINEKWQSYLQNTTNTQNPISTDNPVYTYDSNTEKVNKGNTDLINKYSDTYYNLMNTNPFSTDEAKAILGKYDLSGLQARDNEVAIGGANNGGNIDSFAAANALRQQAALTNQGQMAVLNAHNAKLENIRGLLSDMGVNINRIHSENENTEGRLFNQDETAKTNTVDREVVKSEATGYITDGLNKLTSDLWNEDGSLKPYNVYGGYQTTISELETTLAKTTDETEKARILENLRLLEMARNQKIGDTGLTYGKTYKYQTKQPTYTNTNDTANRESAAELAGQEAEAKSTEAAYDYQKAIDAETIKANADITVANTKAQDDKPSNIEKLEDDQELSTWLYSPKDTDNESAYKGYDDSNKGQYIAAEKLSDESVIPFIKKALANSGFDADKKFKEYRENVAIEIAKIEGKDYQDKDVIAEIYKRYKW